MKYITFSLVLTISFLILITSVYAETLRTDIIRKFFTITGMASELETTTTAETTTETTPTTGETVAPPAEATPVPVCPDIGMSCLCSDGSGCPKLSDEKGCTYWGPCPEVKPVEGVPTPTPEEPIIIKEACPPQLMVMPQCPEGEQPVTKFDEKGCPYGYECLPMAKPPEGQPGITCPEKQTCSDGSTVPCRIENNNCICESCPIKQENIPPGCWQVVDKETGFVKIACGKMDCPDEAKNAETKRRCAEEGGTPIPQQNPIGCTFYDCKFGERQKEEAMPNPIYGYEKCPPPEEIDMSMRKCRDMGMSGSISFEGGCKVAKCVEEKEERCKIIAAEMRLRIEEECGKKGFKTIKDFDENGCPLFKCAGEEFCKKDLPKEAFEECRKGGGEMIVKRDDRGCVVYSNCVERGDQREVYVEPVESVPEPTELLSVAFKLEQMKIELDKLARQADDIANYYASVNSPEEHRFRRVSSMFESVKDKIDNVKSDLRDRLETLTPEDMEQIRFDIKSVKESLKDIVYVMLSNSDEVKEIMEVEATRKKPAGEEIVEGANCGTDGSCFDRAIRVCKPITFLPEGRAGPTVTITGLEGDACMLHIELPEGQGPPEFKGKIYMDCQIKGYSFGIKGPEEILPYCKGPMKELTEKYGTKPPGGQPGGPQQFGGPGGCQSDTECQAFCEKNPEECLKWCRENPGMCPPEAEQGLKSAMGGKSVCGNNLCEPDFGETVNNCYDDCTRGSCGNGLCEEDYKESYDTCPTDCMRELKSKNEFNNEGEFLQNARNVGPVATIDFETLPDGRPIYDRMKLSGEEYSSLGVTFYTPTQKYLQAFGPLEPFKPIGALSLSPGPGPFEEGEGYTHDNLNIIFSAPVKAVGFYMLDLGEPDYRESVTFYDEGGRIIETMPLDTFVGFISASAGIQKVVIVEAAKDDDDVAYDNIHFVRMGEVREIGGCDCTWAAGSKEHPTGCTVLCSDYSYDRSACEARMRDGCAWISGTAEAPRVEGTVKPCVGCLNNGICDVGECSECIDCLRR